MIVASVTINTHQSCISIFSSWHLTPAQAMTHHTSLACSGSNILINELDPCTDQWDTLGRASLGHSHTPTIPKLCHVIVFCLVALRDARKNLSCLSYIHFYSICVSYFLLLVIPKFNPWWWLGPVINSNMLSLPPNLGSSARVQGRLDGMYNAAILLLAIPLVPSSLPWTCSNLTDRQFFEYWRILKGGAAVRVLLLRQYSTIGQGTTPLMIITSPIPRADGMQDTLTSP